MGTALGQGMYWSIKNAAWRTRPVWFLGDVARGFLWYRTRKGSLLAVEGILVGS